MAAVTFGTLWLAPVTNLPGAVSFPVRATGINVSPQVNVTARVYAAGNYRKITQPGRQQQVKLDLGFLTAAQAQQILDWQGETLLLRAPDGTKIYGFYTDPAMNPRPAGVGTPTSLTFTEVTVSEAV